MGVCAVMSACGCWCFSSCSCSWSRIGACAGAEANRRTLFASLAALHQPCALAALDPPAVRRALRAEAKVCEDELGDFKLRFVSQADELQRVRKKCLPA